MTDAAAPMEPAVQPRLEEDKVLPAVVYGLYLLGCMNGLTILVAAVVAHVNRATAGPINDSHFTFALRSFWLGLTAFLVGLLIFVTGLPLSLLLIGIPIVMLGTSLMGAVGVWFAARACAGLYYIIRGEAYPRPLSWLI